MRFPQLPYANIRETAGDRHAYRAVELGPAREVVSRILKDFERRGYVNLVRGQVEVPGREHPATFRDALQMGG